MNEQQSGENGFSIHEDTAEEFAITEPPQKTTVAQEMLEWLDVLATAVIAVVIVFSLLFRVATIEGNSMNNTLLSGDKVIITHLAYTPQYGDIVVISRNIDNSVDGMTNSQVPIIKRVIAVAGQTVDIDFDRGVVSVDGRELQEDYTKTPTNLQYNDGVQFPVYVPEGYVFVLGDNRNDSLDSRSARIGETGLVDTRYILGHAVLRVFPFQSMGLLLSQ